MAYYNTTLNYIIMYGMVLTVVLNRSIDRSVYMDHSNYCVVTIAITAR